MRPALLLLSLVVPFAPSEARAQEADPVAEVSELREMLLYARYHEAVSVARALLERQDLSASDRNRALEAKAIAELALDLEDSATATLAQLYARDPGHRLSDADASPQVRSAFARVRESRPDTVPVRLHHESPGALANRDSPVVTVELVDGADAVEELRLAYRHGGETRFDTALMRRIDERTARARVPLLTERSEAYAVEYFIEALAPSRTPLARAGSRQQPFRLVVPEEAGAAPPVLAPPDAPPEPAVPRDESGSSVLGEWWLWTVAALVIGGGIAAYVLLGPPSEGPEEGTLGTATLSLGWNP